MPKFVWAITSRGQWSPQLFHGDMPREMTMPHNAGRYVVHELSQHQCEVLQLAADAKAGSPLAYLASEFPAPAPETTENENDV